MIHLKRRHCLGMALNKVPIGSSIVSGPASPILAIKSNFLAQVFIEHLLYARYS